MENRATFRGEGSSKALMTMFAVIVVLSSAVMLYVATTMTTPITSQTQSGATQAAPISSTEAVDSFDGSGHGFVP